MLVSGCLDVKISGILLTKQLVVLVYSLLWVMQDINKILYVSIYLSIYLSIYT